MTTAVHALRYLHPSALRPRRLALATSGGATPDGEAAHPRFSDGLLRHPDAAAAGLLADSARGTPVRGHPHLLPLPAENGGPCGFAVHQALAYGLGAGHAEDRSVTVDALLSPAAQQQLDPAASARETSALLALGAVKPNRLAAALADPAPRLTWSILAALLPDLLDGPPPRGAADLVAVAVDCARRSAARGPIDAVTHRRPPGRHQTAPGGPEPGGAARPGPVRRAPADLGAVRWSGCSPRTDHCVARGAG